jgi:hypothetical protein
LELEPRHHRPFPRRGSLSCVLLFGLGSTFDEAFLASPRMSLRESKRHFLDLGCLAANQGFPRSGFRCT